MTRKTKSQLSTEATLLAAKRFSRRAMLERTAALGVVASVGPWLAKDALSSSGEINILNWADEVMDPVLPTFTEKTGIKVNSTPFSQNEEQINKLQATGGEGFDLCQPTRDRAPQFRELGLLAPLDLNRVANSKNLIPSMLEGSTSIWTWDGGLYHVPHCWGSEAISWRTDLTTLEYKNLSYGTLWEEQYQGKIQGRPHSLLLGIGLWMDANGQLPTNRMADAFESPERFKEIYDKLLPFAIEHKPWIKQFWDSADNTKSGLLENGVVIGQTWDGPPLTLKKEGKPVSYMAPQEGAITWIDGWAMPSAAKNIDQIYEFLNYLYTPESAAMVAETSSYNPVVVGADALLSDAAKKNFAEAYPEDALQRLWHRIPEPSWFGELRTQYADKFRSA